MSRRPHPSDTSVIDNDQIESVNVFDLVERYGTPVYVYSERAITEAWQTWESALKQWPRECGPAPFHPNRPPVSFAVKANSNLTVLALLHRLGAGFDVVSGGELLRVLAVKAPADRIVYSGVAKTAAELRLACQSAIACINLESEFEFDLLARVLTDLGDGAPKMNVAIRINPDVGVDTHSYITTGNANNKFGVSAPVAMRLASRVDKHPRMIYAGLVSHIGSQLFQAQPYQRTLERLLATALTLHQEGITGHTIGMGGGWGVDYTGDDIDSAPAVLVEALAKIWRAHPAPARIPGLSLAFEPGRSIVAKAGVLFTRVLGVKRTESKNFAVIDAAMNDLIRPALYHARHRAINLSQPIATAASGAVESFDLVGAVCESGDFLARDCRIPAQTGDTLAVLDTGAYGFVMSSNYNSRPRPAELMVCGKRVRMIRPRERAEDLYADELLLLDEAIDDVG